MRKLLAFVVGLFGACAPVREHRRYSHEDQLLATWIVWQDELGHYDDDPPPITWIDRAPCPLDTTVDGFDLDGRCVGGAYWPDTYEIRIMWYGNFSGSAFAHELYHAHLHLVNGFLDYTHSDPGWTTTVPRINERLAAEGL